MKKKIFKIISLVILGITFLGSYTSFAAEDNVISEAYAERRAMMLDLIGGGKLENEIEKLKTELGKLEVGIELSEETKNKILTEIESLETEITELNQELITNVEDSTEFDQLLESYYYEVNIKKDLVEQLNTEIKENEINYEKIDLLIEKYLQEKEKLDDDTSKNRFIKIIIFIAVTLVSLFVYFLGKYLVTIGKLSMKKSIYINFFLAFAYIIFLIWFFFYLYPEFSIFLIFMSGYLLVINSHLIGSFVGSVIVFQRFKIGDIIKTGNVHGKISNISPLYITLTPLNNEGIYINKPVYIPHINILRESITKDINPNILYHTFKITIKEDSGLDVMKFLNDIETNILQKFLHNKLKTTPRSEDFYRISFDYTNTAHLIIIFNWEGDNVLNNKVERKIVGSLTNSILKIRKAKESLKDSENEAKKKDEEQNIDNGEEKGVLSGREEEVR